MLDRLIELLGIRIAEAAHARKFRGLVRNGVVDVGEHTYGVPRVLTFRGNRSRLIIGKFVSIASGATFVLGGNHPTNWVSTFPFRARWKLPSAYEDGMPSSRGDIIVGADSWIGHEALVLSGVSIGVGAVIGARSVVSTNVPNYAVITGNPGRVAKFRFDERVRQKLADSRWWEREDSWLREHVHLLSTGEVEQFLAIAGDAGAIDGN